MKKKLSRNGDQTVAEFLAAYRPPVKWWYIVLLIGLGILMVIVLVNVSKLGN